MIELKNIEKTYKVKKREAGIKNALKSFTKGKYEEVKALSGISFKIDEGEIVGYIGPNGAGKSTTIKIMCGILTPDSGECTINGMVPYKERKKYVKNIGVVFGNRSGLWWDVPVDDSFELIKSIYRIPDSVYKKQKENFIKVLNEINEILKSYVNTENLASINEETLQNIKFDLIDLDVETKAVKSYFAEWSLLWLDAIISLRAIEIKLGGVNNGK